MATEYEKVKTFGPGLLVISRDGDRGRLWSLRKLRKPAKCSGCGTMMHTGRPAFGPVNQSSDYRYERLCEDCAHGRAVAPAPEHRP
jgi:hypothetical protein